MLLATAMRSQVSMHRLRACKLYEQRKFAELHQLLTSLSSAAAVMLNLEISLVHNKYFEESATLARILLIYINRLRDFRFLAPDTIFIMGRFLNILATHKRDSS